MTRFPFSIVDVFAEQRYQGNQLAVFRVPGGLPAEEMLSIAREMNYSESTFIEQENPETRTFKVRIFTPGRELPFAGHPTLGTAYVIQREILEEPVDELTLDLKAGKIPVTFTYRDGEPDILWMKQLPPEFLKVHDRDTFAGLLNLEPEDMDPEFPVQEVSTGVPFFMVPLRNRAALEKARVDEEAFLRYVEGTESKAPLIFCREPRSSSNQVAARMYGISFGIKEDPATGSANGCLAGYMSRYRYLGSENVDARVEQGYEMGRPSLLYLKSGPDGDQIEVHVGGKVAPIAQGHFE